MSADPITIALVGFASALAGGLLQAGYARRFERERFGRQARHEAYSAYFEAVARLAFVRTNQERDAAYSSIADARGRIALYGSTAAVSAMAAAFRKGKDLYSSDARPVHEAMIHALRADVNTGGGAAPTSDLFELLYGRERGR